MLCTNVYCALNNAIRHTIVGGGGGVIKELVRKQTKGKRKEEEEEDSPRPKSDKHTVEIIRRMAICVGCWLVVGAGGKRRRCWLVEREKVDMVSAEGERGV